MVMHVMSCKHTNTNLVYILNLNVIIFFTLSLHFLVICDSSERTTGALAIGFKTLPNEMSLLPCQSG